MNPQNSNDHFSFPDQYLTSPSADPFIDSYSEKYHPPSPMKEDYNALFQNPNWGIEGYDGNLDNENNFNANDQIPADENPPNALENGADPPLENPSNIASDPVDDYSLYYIFSMGLQYCATLEPSDQEGNINNGAEEVNPNPREEGNHNPREEGNPNHGTNHAMQILPTIPPAIESPKEVNGDGYGGETGKKPLEENQKAILQNSQPFSHQSLTYPGISSYVGNLETFLQGAPCPQPKGNIASRFKGKEEALRAYVMESSNFQSKSSTPNFTPNYDELKEMSKYEYWTALKSKSKDISEGTSSSPRIPKFSTKKSDNKKGKALLWSLQDCKDTESDTQASGKNGEAIQEAGQNNPFQYYHNYNFAKHVLNKTCSQDSEFQTNPSFSFGSGSGGAMENLDGESSKDVDEDDMILGLWEECGPFPPFGDDCCVLQTSQNKDVQMHHGQDKSCIKQKSDGNSDDGSNQGCTMINGSSNPDLTIMETVKLPTDHESLFPMNELFPIENSTKPTCPAAGDEGLEFLKQDGAESFSSDWINDLSFATELLANDK